MGKTRGAFLMNVIIAGGGRVGFHLARLLSQEDHNVTVVEVEPTKVEYIDYALDVSCILGTATSSILLKGCGIDSAHLFIAATGNDEINLLAAAMAKGLGAERSVARVDNPTHLETADLFEHILAVDHVLSPDALTASDILTYIKTPGMVAVENFGRGLIQMRQMQVAKTPTSNGKTLKDVDLPHGVLLGMLSRNGKTMIPHGNTVIETGDIATVIGQRAQIEGIQGLFQDAEAKYKSVVIMGGGSIGLHLAKALEEMQLAVKLFDFRLSRCNELAASLKRAKVVCRDATQRIDLEQEHIGKADMFVAATNDDERNIMASVLAKEVGVSNTVAVVHQPDFVPLLGKLGIDHAVTPRACFASRVLKLVHQKKVSRLAVLEEGEVEILEFKVTGGTPVIGQRLEDIKFPRGALVAAILRGDCVIVPSGSDEVHAHDMIIVIAPSDSLKSLQKLFIQ